jgi:hypothetical protein
MCRHLRRVGERQPGAVTPGGRLSGFLLPPADRDDLELRQRLERRDMGNRGEAPAGAGADYTDPKFVARSHDLLPPT